MSEPSAAPPTTSSGRCAPTWMRASADHAGQPVDRHPARTGQVGRRHRGQGERHGAVARHEPEPVVGRAGPGDVAGDHRGRAGPARRPTSRAWPPPTRRARSTSAPDRGTPAPPRHPRRRGDGRRGQRAAELHRQPQHRVDGVRAAPGRRRTPAARATTAVAMRARRCRPAPRRRPRPRAGPTCAGRARRGARAGAGRPAI